VARCALRDFHIFYKIILCRAHYTFTYFLVKRADWIAYRPFKCLWNPNTIATKTASWVTTYSQSLRSIVVLLNILVSLSDVAPFQQCFPSKIQFSILNVFCMFCSPQIPWFINPPMGRIPFWNPSLCRDFNSPFISSLQIQIFCSGHYTCFKKLHFNIYFLFYCKSIQKMEDWIKERYLNFFLYAHLI
jgi:hypothetical protein